jgi:bla regulator protein blaR1
MVSRFITRRLFLSAAVISALCQAQSLPKEFDVATIKPNSANDNRFMIRPLPGGGLTITGVPLKMLIMEAFDVRTFQVSGGPGWMSTERWDIEAKTEGVQAQLPIGQTLKMLRALITDRFHLEVHHDTKEMTIYALVVGKNGSKLTRHTGEPPPPTDRLRITPGSLSAKQIGIAALVRQLTLQVGRPVIDKTGLTGTYDLTLEWSPEPGQGGPESIGLPPDARLPPPSDWNGPSIFTALQEQLGLRLDAQKGPVDIIVIDRAERPDEN